MRHQDTAWLHATFTAGVEFFAEQNLSRADWVGGVYDNGVKPSVGPGDIFGAVVDHGFEAFIGKDRPGEFRKVLLGELNDGGVNLDLSKSPDRLMLEYLLGDAAIAAADDEHVLGLTMGEQRHMRHHFLVDELVLLGDLRRAIEHEHLAEEAVLEQHKVLMLGVQLVKHLVDFEGHAKTEVVEQCLWNPARVGRFLGPFRGRFFGRMFDRFFHRCSPRDSLPADGGPSCAINANSVSEYGKSGFCKNKRPGRDPAA